MPIVYEREDSLSYEFSPANFDNSPANFDNSLANFDNSAANFDNSSGNFDNSPSNFDNRVGGGHRLYYTEDGLHMTWAGYFVVRSGNYINFFSPTGNRVFYSPAGHAGVFSAEMEAFVEWSRR